ncbi:beta strand repeat-containing protein [Arsenicibacter rosenii]|uniref:beta strand repeat-containing protein n=1 Tax=Arsenicibacter rosenii TaxID=1750698 RepID=UPI001C433C64|nr:CSLREA domain-containing protein [Arsenicibacter rosenii]
MHAQVFYAQSDGSGGTSGDQLRSVNINGTNDRQIATGFTSNIGAIAADRANNRVFVSNGVATGGAIYAVDVTSGVATTFLNTSSIVQGMAVDNVNGYLYYTLNDNQGTTTTDELRRIGLDGTGDVRIATGFALIIGDIALDVANDRAFIGDRSTSTPKIFSVNLSTGTATTLVTITAGSTSRGLAVDLTNGYLYYAINDNAVSTNDEIRRIGLTGSGDTRIATNFVTGIGEIALNKDVNKLLVADNNSTSGVIKQITLPANTTATFFTPSTANIITGIEIVDCWSGFTVNSTLDGSDANPGDGVCRTSGGVCTLRAAIQEANALTSCGPLLITLPAGQTIGITSALPTVTFSGTIAGGSELCPATGTGGSTIARTSAAEFGIFYQTGGQLTLRDLTIANGNAPSGNDLGGAIALFSNCTLLADRCVFRNNVAGSGGAIYSAGGSVSVNETFFDDNSASLGSAGYFNQGSAVITNSSVRHEMAVTNMIFDLAEGSLVLKNIAIGGNGPIGEIIRQNAGYGGPSSLSVLHSTFNLPNATYLIESNKYAATQRLYLQNNVFGPSTDNPLYFGGSSGSLNSTSGGGNVFARDADAGNIPGAGFTPVASDKQNVGAALALGSLTTVSGACLPVVPLGCFSPAINAAVSSTITTDILGNTQVGSARDAGSYESTNAASVTFTVAGSGTACAGRALTLTASGCTGGTVNWPGGITGNVYSNTLAGIYTATCTVGACATTASGTITAGAAPSIAVPVLTTAVVGNALANALSFTASGVGAPFTFAYSALPAGITLSSNTSPILSFNGTPTEPGTYPISITATNSNNCQTVSNTYALTVSCATMAVSASANPATCQGAGSLTFVTTLPAGTYSVSYTGSGSPKTVTVSGGRFTVTGLPAGTYSNFSLTYGSGACLLTDNRTITLTDPASPTVTVTANQSGSLTCSQTSLTLTATGGSSYTFTGPGILSQNALAGTAVVNAAGVYSVTGSNAAGCRDTDQTTVTGSTTAPTGVGLSASQSGTLTCTSRSLTLTASATGSGLSYVFSGPGVLAQSGSSATVNASGTYTVVVTGSNGCTATATTTVYSNTTAPSVSLLPSSATLTCASPVVTLTATAGYANYAFSSGQNGPGNTLTVSSAGTYSVVATGANGCTATTSVGVQSSTAVITGNLTASGAISCPSPSVTLTATPASLTYTFGGGASQIGTTNQAVVNVAGLYSVTITDASGCTAVAQTTVTGSTTAPTGVGLSASQSGTLTCTSRSLTLTASATGSGLSYVFSGPGVLAQSGSSATVNASGTYTVVVTGSNGCTATATTTVYSNTTAPSVSLLPSSATLTCASPVVTLTATAGYANYAFSSGQNGPGNTLTVSSAGPYSVVATGANGCTATTSVGVQSSTSAPTVSITPMNATLTCASPTVVLTAIGSGTAVWSTGVSASTILAGTAGLYSVTLTNASGCTATTSTFVNSNTILAGLVATVNGALGCGSSSAQIIASAPGAASFTVLGPSAYQQTNTNGQFTVTTAGQYTVIAIGTSGCMSSTTVTVISGGVQPTASNLVASGVLGGGVCQLTLSANIVGDRAVFTGPGGYVFTNAYRTPAARTVTAPMVKQPGTYTLKVYSGNCESVYTIGVTGTACQE